GANTYFTGTADVGLTAIGRAFRAIRRGESDIALAGGFDDPVNSWQMVKLESLGLMSTRNDLGPGACRPYDRDREGTILGEGAALLVLEEREHAVGRGARIYAEVVGFGSTFDTAGRLTPDPDGRSVTTAVVAALREADVGADDVGYVAAHGSGTRLGDPSEARGRRGAFGAAGGGGAARSGRDTEPVTPPGRRHRCRRGHRARADCRRPLGRRGRGTGRDHRGRALADGRLPDAPRRRGQGHDAPEAGLSPSLRLPRPGD